MIDRVASPENPLQQRAWSRAKSAEDLVWHAGAFLIVNAFLWMMDMWLAESGIQWAYWVTLPWAFGLSFHVLAYWVQGRGIRERKYRQFLDEENAAFSPDDEVFTR